MTVVKHPHENTEVWIKSDGPRAVPVRRSLVKWMEKHRHFDQVTAIIALIDMAKHTAASQTDDYREFLAEELYRAAEHVVAPPSND